MIICLSMIVKNESQIILRCLNSTLSIINFLVISDTGSTDQTSTIIENWAKENNILYSINNERFQNFAHNRNRVFEQTINFLQDNNVDLTQTYILLLDADMVLKVNDKEILSTLNKDYYLLAQYDNHLTYYNVRLIRASRKWLCRGITHEFWTFGNDEHYEGDYLSQLVIDDHCDGGCKSDKFDRDIRLLKLGLEELKLHPDSYLLARYYFYLALTYQYHSDYKEAIEWYEKRIALPIFSQERFYAIFSIARCWHKLNNYAKASDYYIKASLLSSERLEPIYYLAQLHNQLDNKKLVHSLLNQGKEIYKNIASKLDDNDKYYSKSLSGHSFIEHNIYKFFSKMI